MKSASVSGTLTVVVVALINICSGLGQPKFSTETTERTPQVSSAPSYNASQVAENQLLTVPYPFEFPALKDGALVNSGNFPMSTCHGFTLEEATIDQIQQALANGALTVVALATCYLQRIYQTDPYLRFVVCNRY